MYIDEVGPTTENVSIVYLPAADKTDMNSDQLMTANSVRGYVEENVATVDHMHKSTDIRDIIYEYTTNDLYFHVDPPFKVEGNEVTIDTQYISNFENWRIICDIFILF